MPGTFLMRFDFDGDNNKNTSHHPPDTTQTPEQVIPGAHSHLLSAQENSASMEDEAKRMNTMMEMTPEMEALIASKEWIADYDDNSPYNANGGYYDVDEGHYIVLPNPVTVNANANKLDRPSSNNRKRKRSHGEREDKEEGFDDDRPAKLSGAVEVELTKKEAENSNILQNSDLHFMEELFDFQAYYRDSNISSTSSAASNYQPPINDNTAATIANQQADLRHQKQRPTEHQRATESPTSRAEASIFSQHSHQQLQQNKAARKKRKAEESGGNQPAKRQRGRGIETLSQQVGGSTRGLRNSPALQREQRSVRERGQTQQSAGVMGGPLQTAAEPRQGYMNHHPQKRQRVPRAQSQAPPKEQGAQRQQANVPSQPLSNSAGSSSQGTGSVPKSSQGSSTRRRQPQPPHNMHGAQKHQENRGHSQVPNSMHSFLNTPQNYPPSVNVGEHGQTYANVKNRPQGGLPPRYSAQAGDSTQRFSSAPEENPHSMMGLTGRPQQNPNLTQSAKYQQGTPGCGPRHGEQRSMTRQRESQNPRPPARYYGQPAHNLPDLATGNRLFDLLGVSERDRIANLGNPDGSGGVIWRGLQEGGNSQRPRNPVPSQNDPAGEVSASTRYSNSNPGSRGPPSAPRNCLPNNQPSVQPSQHVSQPTPSASVAARNTRGASTIKPRQYPQSNPVAKESYASTPVTSSLHGSTRSSVTPARRLSPVSGKNMPASQAPPAPVPRRRVLTNSALAGSIYASNRIPPRGVTGPPIRHMPNSPVNRLTASRNSTPAVSSPLNSSSSSSSASIPAPKKMRVPRITHAAGGNSTPAVSSPLNPSSSSSSSTSRLARKKKRASEGRATRGNLTSAFSSSPLNASTDSDTLVEALTPASSDPDTPASQQRGGSQKANPTELEGENLLEQELEEWFMQQEAEGEQEAGVLAVPEPVPECDSNKDSRIEEDEGSELERESSLVRDLEAAFEELESEEDEGSELERESSLVRDIEAAFEELESEEE